nr:hypothetical protein CFP56_14380 [Quercus suber]
MMSFLNRMQVSDISNMCNQVLEEIAQRAANIHPPAGVSQGAIATEVYQSDIDADEAVDEVLNEPKAEWEETGFKLSFSASQSKSSSTKDSSNEFTRQALGQGSSESIDRIGHEGGSTESIDSEDDDIKSFYTSLGADSQSASNSVITNVQSKKTRPGQFNIDKALDMVKNVLTTDFSSACHPGCSISLNSALELLCYMDENDGISVKMKDLVLQISKDFTVLKIRFYQASNTIQRCTNLIKPMAEIASQLDENKQKFLKLDSVEATIQRSIIEAETQINEHMHDKCLGSKEILKNLHSLKDLYIEDCPMLQSLPEDGLPSSLQHLQIQKCPLLAKRCQKEGGGGGGPDRPKLCPRRNHQNQLAIVFLPHPGGIEIIDARPTKKQPNSSHLKQSHKVCGWREREHEHLSSSCTISRVFCFQDASFRYK